MLGFDLGGTPMELMNNPFLKLNGEVYVPFTAGEKMATIIYTLGKIPAVAGFSAPSYTRLLPQTHRHHVFQRWS